MTLRQIKVLPIVLSLTFAWLCYTVTPDRLAAIGIMDASLASDNPMTRAVALLEVKAFQIGLGVLAVLLLAIALFGKQLQETRRYRRFMARDMSFNPAYERILLRTVDTGLIVMVGLVAFFLLYIGTAERLFAPTTLETINREDGVIEYGSALLLLLAALVAAYTALIGETRLKTKGFLLFLSLLFVFMCGEEISWGQRIIGFETSEALSRINVQQEVNLHNMFGYLFDHLFIVAFFLWGCVLPAFYHLSDVGRQIVRWFGLPIPSIGLAIGMFLTTIFQNEIVYHFFDPVQALRIPEVREFLSATAFLLMMMQCLRGFRSSRPEDRSTHDLSKSGSARSQTGH